MDNLNPKFQSGSPRPNDRASNRFLTVFMVLVLLGALGTLGYIIAKHNIGEKFTEFYILGPTGKAQDYPTEYVMDGGLAHVVNSSTGEQTNNDSGKITVDIVNHEQKTEFYTVKVILNNAVSDFKIAGSITDQIGPVKLEQGEKWENQISIIPHQVGDNQKVEIMLFKGSVTTPDNTLRLWINVKPAN
jgi:uncharacterized membrane protein